MSGNADKHLNNPHFDQGAQIGVNDNGTVAEQAAKEVGFAVRALWTSDEDMDALNAGVEYGKEHRAEGGDQDSMRQEIENLRGISKEIR